jgi:putative Mg2+ transporter-C (MgtC) family protein
METVIQFVLATIWGGIVGAEREYRSKSAGFRTMIMISLGSCFFTKMSVYMGGEANPDRIAASIVTGIGFLGAGVILRQENKVTGITTAATIWAVAAIGMGIGAGHYYVTSVAGLLSILVLVILPRLEIVIDAVNQRTDYTIVCVSDKGARERYEELLLASDLRYKLLKQQKEGSDLKFTWQVQGKARNHKQFTASAVEDETIKDLIY